MEAIGKDGQFHQWDELTTEEQQAWRKAMSEVDNCYKEIRHRPTLQQLAVEREIERTKLG